MTTRAKISVVGGGAVGKAIAAFYDQVKIYDKYRDSDPIEEVCAADFIFVAVPTPYSEGHDLEEMDDALENISKNLTDKDNQVVIIKSTVLPGTTDKYQEKYREMNLVFNPEFLTESVAVEDFAHPDKQLVGYTAKTKDLAEKVLGILPDAPYAKVLPARDCEMTKYTINSYYAFKVIFGNLIYDFCEKLGADYDVVREGLAADLRIVDSHFDVFHGGFRGFGGKCLPKDVKTLSWFAEKIGAGSKLLQVLIQRNQQLAGEQEKQPAKVKEQVVNE